MMYMCETGLNSMIKFITFHLLSLVSYIYASFENKKYEKLCRPIGMK